MKADPTDSNSSNRVRPRWPDDPQTAMWTDSDVGMIHSGFMLEISSQNPAGVDQPLQTINSDVQSSNLMTNIPTLYYLHLWSSFFTCI